MTLDLNMVLLNAICFFAFDFSSTQTRHKVKMGLTCHRNLTKSLNLCFIFPCKKLKGTPKTKPKHTLTDNNQRYTVLQKPSGKKHVWGSVCVNCSESVQAINLILKAQSEKFKALAAQSTLAIPTHTSARQ